MNDHLPAIKIAAKTYNIREGDLNINSNTNNKEDLNKSNLNGSLIKDKSISELGITKIKKRKGKMKFN